MRVAFCLMLVAVVTIGVRTEPSAAHATPARPAVDRSRVHWDRQVQKAVEDKTFEFSHRLVEQSGRYYLEWEYQGDRQRVELTDQSGPVEMQAGVLKARVSEVRVSPAEKVGARLRVEAFVLGSSFTLVDQTTHANYGLGVTLSDGRAYPGLTTKEHGR